MSENNPKKSPYGVVRLGDTTTITLIDPQESELFLVARTGNIDKLKLWLDYGLNPSMVAINKIDMFTPKGWTPLMAAARFDQAEAIRLLVERGADFNYTRVNEEEIAESALDIAIKFGSQHAEDILRSYQEKINLTDMIEVLADEPAVHFSL